MKKVRELVAQMCEGKVFEAEGTACARVPGKSMPRVLQGGHCGGAEEARGWKAMRSVCLRTAIHPCSRATVPTLHHILGMVRTQILMTPPPEFQQF